MKNYKFSICIPTFNGALYIKETLDSILGQSYQKFEVIISDDYSTDNTIETVKSYKDKRIKIYKTTKNLGYGDNLKTFRKRISGEIMYMMAQDDILSPDALLLTNKAYNLEDDIGAVIRPYYQFDTDPKIPVRYAPPPDPEKDLILSILDIERKTMDRVIEASGLLSAISYRVKYMDTDFHSHVFPAHAYPFFSILKKHKAVFLHNYIIAVRIFSSQARFKSSIYEPSPVYTWVNMFKTLFPEKKYKAVRKYCIDYSARNYVGLVQIKNFGSYRNLLREIFILLKYRWINIFNIKFWFYSLACLFTLRFLLVKIADAYKNRVLSKVIKSKIKMQL